MSVDNSLMIMQIRRVGYTYYTCLFIYIYIETSGVTSFVETWKHSYLPILLNWRLLLSWIFYI